MAKTRTRTRYRNNGPFGSVVRHGGAATLAYFASRRPQGRPPWAGGSGPQTAARKRTATSQSYTSTRTKKKRRVSRKKRSWKGRYRGPVKRGKRVVSASQFQKFGSIYRYENGGVCAANQLAWVGVCDSPFQKVHRSVSRAIVKLLMREAGLDIIGWDNIPLFPANLKIQWAYRASVNAAVSPITTVPDLSIDGVAVTYSDIAELLAADFQARIGTDVPGELVFIKLYDGVTKIPLALLWASQITLDFHNTAHLKLQNRTFAAHLSSGIDGDDEEADNVSNQPVTCRLYEFRGNCLVNRTQPKNPTGLCTNPYDGSINTNQSGAFDGMKKLPLANQFTNCTGTRPFVLQPGEIKKVSCDYKKVMKLNSFVGKLATNWNTPEAAQQVFFGSSVVVGFEKLLDTHQAISARDMSIGFEYNFDIRCKARYYRSVASAPIIDVAPDVPIP